jgi:hypothetical protein
MESHVEVQGEPRKDPWSTWDGIQALRFLAGRAFSRRNGLYGGMQSDGYRVFRYPSPDFMLPQTFCRVARN